MELQGLHLIAGRASAALPPSFHGVNAASGKPLAPGYSEATPAEIDAALTAAASAGEEFGRSGRKHRSDFLQAIAAEIEALGDPLLARAQEETGLPLARLAGERARTCGQLRLFAGKVAREGLHGSMPGSIPPSRSESRSRAWTCAECCIPSARWWFSVRAIFPSPSPSPAATPLRPWPPAIAWS